MKKEKNKHDHSLTNLLKVFIFSLVMLAPFFAIAVKCGYVMFNKNAQESYKGQYTFTYENRLKMSNIVPNSQYVGFIDLKSYNQTQLTEINNELGNVLTNAIKITVENFTITETYNTQITYSEGYNLQDLNNTTIISFLNFHNNHNNSTWNAEQNTTISDRQRIAFYNNNTLLALIYMQDLPKLSIQCKVTNITKNLPIFDIWFSEWTIYQTEVDTTLSSVFYSAIQELDKASIFSWTTKTVIYTSIVGMTEGLGIVSPPLAVLITYWTIIIGIYIIFDIVIQMFVFLTHWASEKI